MEGAIRSKIFWLLFGHFLKDTALYLFQICGGSYLSLL